MISIDSSFIFTTCDNSFFILIGNQVFNRTTPNGQVILPSVTPSGCDTIVNVDITYGSLNIGFTTIDATCEVPDSGQVIIDTLFGIAPYNILYNGNSIISNILPIIIELLAGSGEIMIMDNSGCDETIMYDILPADDDDYSIELFGDQLTIVGGGLIDSVIWVSSSTLSCTQCIDPVANPSETTTYFVTVYYSGICEMTLEYLFEVIDNIPDYILPTIFSPNGDGQNDNFTLFITEGAIGVPTSLQLFDRWGNMVFTQSDPVQITTTGWDGTNNGTHVSNGVYVYKIAILEGTQLKYIYGDVTVIR